jgi:hypothetical protein
MFYTILSNIIIGLCSISYKHYKQPIFYIKGTGKDYPHYLLYTESENVYKRMDDF